MIYEMAGEDTYLVMVIVMKDSGLMVRVMDMVLRYGEKVLNGLEINMKEDGNMI